MMKRIIVVNVRLVVAAACLLSSASCGSDMLRTGRSPVFLSINALEGAAGSEPDEFVNPLLSDVQVLVEQTINGQTVLVPTIYNDLGRATIRAEMKDGGGGIVAPSAPTALNSVTITRYRVTYRRSDGRNTPGVDVPYGFDGAVSRTVAPGTSTEVIFDLVRHQNKLEAPLRNLVGGRTLGFITTIAEVTFWGHDHAGNEIQISGAMDVQFGDFGDEN